jgi:hypothetical protein
MSKSNGGRISADWGAASASLTIKYNAKHSFPYYKMGRKIPVFVKGGAPKNNTDTSHGISVFSYGIYPTEFYGIDCLIPIKLHFCSPQGNISENRSRLKLTTFSKVNFS